MANWLDGCLLAFIALGAIGGFRSGFFASLARLLVSFASLAAAAVGARPLLAALDRYAGLTARLGPWLAARWPFPGGAWSAAALAHNIAGAVLLYAAFAVVFIAVRDVLGWMTAPLLRRLPRGPLDRLLGAALGAGERLVAAGVVLGAVVALSAVPAFGSLAGAVSSSHWVSALARWLARLPGEGRL